jgi:hypothetical protein
MLLGKEELVMKRGMFPPASLLVAMSHSTPLSDSFTHSTETYFPRTLFFSLPTFSGHFGWEKGIETGVSKDRDLGSPFMKRRFPVVAISRQSSSTTNVRGLVGAGVMNVKRHTSASCGL